jgi:hypothetical protein
MGDLVTLRDEVQMNRRSAGPGKQPSLLPATSSLPVLNLAATIAVVALLLRSFFHPPNLFTLMVGSEKGENP